MKMIKNNINSKNKLIELLGFILVDYSKLQQETSKKLEEFKKGVEDVKIIKRELPRVKKGIDELHYVNYILRCRLDYALEDIKTIDIMYRNGNIKGIANILKKYDFTTKIDKKKDGNYDIS